MGATKETGEVEEEEEEERETERGGGEGGLVAAAMEAGKAQWEAWRQAWRRALMSRVSPLLSLFRSFVLSFSPSLLSPLCVHVCVFLVAATTFRLRRRGRGRGRDIAITKGGIFIRDELKGCHPDEIEVQGRIGHGQSRWESIYLLCSTVLLHAVPRKVLVSIHLNPPFSPFSAAAMAATSVVKHAIHRPTGRMLAIKKISYYKKTRRDMLAKEITTLYSCGECPCTVAFYGAYYTEGFVNIVLEYMDGGSMCNALAQCGPLPEPVLAGVAFQCLWGLAFLHQAHRVHRDIKPSNILINSRGNVKLTDFGVTADIQERTNQLCNTYVGTFKYMSPERIVSSPYGPSSDIWSLGISLIEMATGIYPYQFPERTPIIDYVNRYVACTHTRTHTHSASIYLSIYLSIYISFFLFIYLGTYTTHARACAHAHGISETVSCPPLLRAFRRRRVPLWSGRSS